MNYQEFGEAIERDLEEARQLVTERHCEMGLFRAVASFEWFVKRAFLEPYLQMVAVSFNGELAKLMMSALRRNGWKNEIPGLLRAFWNIDTKEMPAWELFLSVWDLRNAIAHDGRRCDKQQAEHAIHTCEVVLKTLLVNRIDAPRPTLD
jgi:hypothetical protein